MALPVWIVDRAKYPEAEYQLCIDGFNCTIKRSPYETNINWLGYVHFPWSLRKRLNEDLVDQLSVHGGITFDSDDTIGFDTQHGYDEIPILPGNVGWTPPNLTQNFRTYEFVESELKSVIFQIKELFEI